MLRAAQSFYLRVFVSLCESFFAQSHKATKIFEGCSAAGES